MGPVPTKDMPEAAVPVAASGQSKLQRLYPNYIRTIAALAVVQMHAVGGYLFELSPATGMSANWHTANVYYSLLRWASPFFIMLSGSLMLNPGREESTAAFLKKRLGKIFQPFLFWSVIYLAYQYRDNLYFWKAPDWKAFWNLIFFQDIYFHLWFIPMIAGMYLLTPVFRLWLRHAKRADVEYFLALAFVITCLQHFVPDLILIKYIGWLGYVGYYVLGYYLVTYPVRYKRVIYALALLMPPLTALLTWWLSSKTMTYNNLFFVYFSPNVMLLSFAWFLFLRDYDWSVFAGRFPHINQAVTRFSQLSFGVYFIHALLLDVFKNGYIFGIVLHPTMYFNLPVASWYGTFIQAFTIAIFSALTISVLERIPVIRKLIM